jgi:NAD+ synthetase
MEKLSTKLTELRKKRGFDLQDYLDKKLERLRAFFEQTGLNAAVVGLSGGVDSALVASLLLKLALEEDSPLKKISAVIAPIFGAGATGQALARDKAERQAKALAAQSPAFEYQICDLTASYEAMIAANSYTKANAWAEGQMASVLRTPLFYYQAALMQQEGWKSLVVGTTNRDEGAYIGFFGKASDAMVDLQPIADLHKSEVWQLAEALEVLPEIYQDAPRGDVWDQRTDEQMIAAPYWFLELYQRLLEEGEETEFEASLRGEELAFYQQAKANIEALHRHNAHKYQVGSPAHYLDVLPRLINSPKK